jgi:hypothetical protein
MSAMGSKFDLVINLTTAKTLGLTIPVSFRLISRGLNEIDQSCFVVRLMKRQLGRLRTSQTPHSLP